MMIIILYLGYSNILGDLWKFSPVDRTWTWLKGMFQPTINYATRRVFYILYKILIQIISQILYRLQIRQHHQDLDMEHSPGLLIILYGYLVDLTKTMAS